MPALSSQLRMASAMNSGPLNVRADVGRDTAHLHDADELVDHVEGGDAALAEERGTLPGVLIDRGEPRRAQKFPSASSFSMALSKERSATSFFRRTFSCSSSFKRRSSGVFIPP